MITPEQSALYIIAAICAVVCLRIFYRPIKWIIYSCVNCIVGCFLMVVINSLTAIQVGINGYTALVAGVLSVPGVILMYVIKYMQ